MQIPPAIRIPICIEWGSVFNFFHDAKGAGRQSKNRYFVVMNRNPKTDAVILLVTSTSQIAKKRKYVRSAGFPEDTVVEVASAEYGPFSCDSAFNCNDLIEVKLSDLITKVASGGSADYPKMPDSIMKKLIRGVKESPMVSEESKRLL